MIFLRLHKWLISLTLIVSVVSFSGSNYSSVVANSNQTELLVAKKPVYKTTSFYVVTVHNQLNSSFCFSFKTLLKSSNSVNDIKFETVKNKALQYVNYLHFKTISHRYSLNDYRISSLG